MSLQVYLIQRGTGTSLSEIIDRWRLFSICNVYIDIYENNTLEGGCPILNTAIESDDGHLLLKERSQQAMKLFIDRLSMIIVEGIEKKEFDIKILFYIREM